MYSRFKKVVFNNAAQWHTKIAVDNFALTQIFGRGIRRASQLVNQFQTSCIYTFFSPTFLPTYLRHQQIPCTFPVLFLFPQVIILSVFGLSLTALPYLELIDNCSAHLITWLTCLGMCGMVPPSDLGRTYLIWPVSYPIWISACPPPLTWMV